MRHIALRLSISTNEFAAVYSAFGREMRHIVLCVSISVYLYENAYDSLLCIGERNETHCSMCVYFYE